MPLSVRAEFVEARQECRETKMAFYVYILECADGSYYTGHTDNIEKRIAAHETAKIPGYTASRLPVTVKFVQEFPSRYEALACEIQVKGWSRKKKEALFKGDWKEVSRLAHQHGPTADKRKEV